jgi:hypothetical protein
MLFSDMPGWRKILVLAIAVVVGVIIFSTIKNLIQGDRGRIKRIIYQAKRATEREDPFKCISFVSRNYIDEYGNDRRGLFLLAKQTFDIYDDIIIGIRQLDISLDTDTAEAKVEATGVAKNVESRKTNIFETETIKFLIYFQKEKRHWKVIKLELLESQSVFPQGII